MAAASGAAFLCYVTPAEHLALPNVDDVKQGIVASKIAAHAADIAKGIPHARDIDDKMGDACRPGCLADATDVCQIEELVRLGELTKRAWAHNVQVMVEGPGHVPLNQVAANMEVQKSICMGAPFYVLGPLP